MSEARFQIGQRVYSKSRDRQGTIIRHTLIGREIHYEVDLGTGTPVLLSERDLQPVHSPLDQLAAGDFGYASDFEALTQATRLQFAYRYERLSCLSNSRLDPKPYQVFVAHRVLQDLYPRYLLADEVGLGKTIEAGLILKELKARGLADRVLVVVPASLCEQWKGEMANKFNERFHIYSRATIQENLRREPGRNPWEGDSQIIVSIQFARQQTSQAASPTPRARQREEQPNRWIDEADWDLVIFDEAHHLRRYLKGSGFDSGHDITKSYRLGEALATRARSLLLLTATPLQLSRYETYSLVELLDARLFPSYPDFETYTALTRMPSWKCIMKVVKRVADGGGEAENGASEVGPAWECEPEKSGGTRDELVELVERLSGLGDSVFSTFEPLLQWHITQEMIQDFWRDLLDCCRCALHKGEYSRVEEEVQRLRRRQRSVELFEGFARSPYVLAEAKVVHQEEARREMARFESELSSFASRYAGPFRKWIENQHRLSRVMIRNRKREVLKGEFVERRAFKVHVDLTAEERDLYDLVSNHIKVSYARVMGQTAALGFVLTTFRKLLVSSSRALATSLERRARRIEETLGMAPNQVDGLPEDELEERAETLESVVELDDLLALTGGLSIAEARAEVATLRQLAERARSIPVDSKAQMLVQQVKAVLDSDPTEKVLIFTQFRETQTYLRELFETEGFQIALFHGEQGPATYDRRHEFERFKKSPDVRIMISTDVGGEGLNFQFCHVMFNYDLPWNPMRIEQRIGRLDRIGQRRDVHIYNFFLEGTLDARILTVLQDRVRLFEETIGNLDPILGDDMERDIRDIVLADEAKAEERLADFEEQAERRTREAREAEEKMADFIMDMRSFRRDTVDKILGRRPPISNHDIETFTRAFFARYPQPDLFREQSENIYIVTVPAAFRRDCERLYGFRLREEYEGTFDPATAIREETVDFLAFGHPLIDAVVRYCVEHEKNEPFKPRSAVRILHDPDLVGFEGLQFNYVLGFEGVRSYRKLIPVVVRLKDGAYDAGLSERVLSLSADERLAEKHHNPLSEALVHHLHERSRAIVAQIAEREMDAANRRNEQEYAEMHEKRTRQFDYQLQHQGKELQERTARLEDARQKGQMRVIPAWEGQVRATQERIRELEAQRERQLAVLEHQRKVQLSIELLNVAYVKVM